MKYKLLYKRRLALVGDIPISREFPSGAVFVKEGTDGGIVFLSHKGLLICVSKETLRADFESEWGNTILFRRIDESEES